jgi:hypothetical protein
MIEAQTVSRTGQTQAEPVDLELQRLPDGSSSPSDEDGGASVRLAQLGLVVAFPLLLVDVPLSVVSGRPVKDDDVLSVCVLLLEFARVTERHFGEMTSQERVIVGFALRAGIAAVQDAHIHSLVG